MPMKRATTCTLAIPTPETRPASRGSTPSRTPSRGSVRVRELRTSLSFTSTPRSSPSPKPEREERIEGSQGVSHLSQGLSLPQLSLRPSRPERSVGRLQTWAGSETQSGPREEGQQAGGQGGPGGQGAALPRPSTAHGAHGGQGGHGAQKAHDKSGKLELSEAFEGLWRARASAIDKQREADGMFMRPVTPQEHLLKLLSPKKERATSSAHSAHANTTEEKESAKSESDASPPSPPSPPSPTSPTSSGSLASPASPASPTSPKSPTSRGFGHGFSRTWGGRRSGATGFLSRSPRPSASEPSEPSGPIKRIRKLGEGEKIFDLYYWEKVLQQEGDGGKVVVCRPKDQADEEFKFVMKIKSKESLREDLHEEEFARAQTRLLNFPPHPGVIRLREVLEDETFYYVVMDRASGGPFFECLLQDTGARLSRTVATRRSHVSHV